MASTVWCTPQVQTFTVDCPVRAPARCSKPPAVPRLAFVVNNPDFLVSHRLVLVKGAQAAGYDVHAIAPEGAGVATLEALGVPVHRWQLDRKGQRATEEAFTVARVVDLYRRLKPDVVHHVTIKPVLYGSAAAHATGVRGIVNAVSGLGYIFLASGLGAELRRRAVAAAYRAALGAARTQVILQNDDDEADLRRLGALGPGAHVVKIRGSGVDLHRFSPSAEPTGTPVVVLPARLLKDKGVVEFVEAARLLRAQRRDVRMVLVGGLDPGNPAAVTQAELDGWLAEGAVEWWGHRNDMPQVFREANLVCLPSYREGLPKALLEAAAAGRAIVTTDAPGCRDVVDFGRLGPLVPVRDAVSLAREVGRLLDPAVRGPLAQQLARHAAAHFSEQQVLTQHLAVYDHLLNPTSAARVRPR